MKILVTGGLGFIGSNFILKLLNENDDYDIINVDAELYGSNVKNLSELKNQDSYQFVKGNITNKRLMEDLISKCDTVINFAAESHVDRSISDPNSFLVSNIRGTFIILDIITKQKKRLVQISTDEVFGSLESGSADEETGFNPSSPYAATKASAELLVKSYSKTFNSDVIITRCTNNYGPRQFPEKLIPKTIILAKQNKKIPVYGKGNNIRDWIYVDDHCEAVLAAFLQGKSGTSYNIAGKNEIENIVIIKKILELMGKNDDLIEYVEDRPGHDYRYSMSSEKIFRELNWSSKIKFEDGLQNTISWYLNNEDSWMNVPSNIFNPTPWKD